MSFLSLVRSDVAVWARVWAPDARWGDPLTGVRLAWTYVGLRATLLYRLSSALHRRRVRVLPQMLWRLNIMLHGFDVPPAVEIGPGLYVPHPVATVVMARRIGSRVTLVSGVTVGMRHEPSFPTIGDDVYIGAGARVLGAITVGNGARIGANAVVLQDVPAWATAVGVPARLVPGIAPGEEQSVRTARTSSQAGG